MVIVFLKKLLFDFVIYWSYAYRETWIDVYAICITYVNVYLLFIYGGYRTRNDLSHVAFNRYKRVLKEDILKS